MDVLLKIVEALLQAEAEIYEDIKAGRLYTVFMPGTRRLMIVDPKGPPPYYPIGRN